MRILAFSDWRVQSFSKLFAYIDKLDKKLDIIVYAGDDINRFNKAVFLSEKMKTFYDDNSLNTNHFEDFGKKSKYGIFAVAGNDDPPGLINKAIKGKKVFNVHKKNKYVDNYAFIGLEGSTGTIGRLLYSEKEVEAHLSKKIKQVPKKKKIIVVSHTPPYEILDGSVRFGKGHIGSKSLRRILQKFKTRVVLCICGHSHLQGGNEDNLNGIKVVNCASHDNEGEPGKIALIDIEADNISIKWDEIYDAYRSELMENPLIGSKRAETLLKNKITTIKQLAQLPPNHKLSNTPQFSGSFELIINYAKAITQEKPIVIKKHPFFQNLNINDIYFFDTEYDPEGGLRGPFGIFLLGWMDDGGTIVQHFLDKKGNEKEILQRFDNWIRDVNPVLVTYSSKSADLPQLTNCYERLGIPTDKLHSKDLFFDLYYDCINTQSNVSQSIYLPMKGSMDLKSVVKYFGFSYGKSSIKDGLMALIEYNTYLKTRSSKKEKQIKNQLMKYHQHDLKGTRHLFNKLRLLFDEF